MAEFTVKGTQATARHIAALGPRVETRMRGVMRAVAESRLTEMKRRTPVAPIDGGTLRSSLHVTGPRRTFSGQEGGRWAERAVCGGPARGHDAAAYHRASEVYRECGV